MGFDVLILNSGAWVLRDELPAFPWHVLIYHQRGRPSDELHVWLPRQGRSGSDEFAFKRFWTDRAVRWCVEVPPEVGRPRRPRGAAAWVRFSSPEGRVLWAEHDGGEGLGDLSDAALGQLLETARAGSFSSP